MQIQNINANSAWEIVVKHIQEMKNFTSVTGIRYKARLTNETVFYKGGNRNSGNEEDINKSEFILAFESIKRLGVINTNTIKEFLPNSLYRKRTPFIGLLYTSGIIK